MSFMKDARCHGQLPDDPHTWMMHGVVPVKARRWKTRSDVVQLGSGAEREVPLKSNTAIGNFTI